MAQRGGRCNTGVAAEDTRAVQRWKTGRGQSRIQHMEILGTAS